MVRFFEHLEGFIAGKFAIGKDLLTLFHLEARLAGLHVVPVIVGIAALIAICFSLWLTTMVLIAYLLALVVGTLLALIIVFFINFVALAFIIKFLLSCTKQMTFEKTRALLIGEHPKESHHGLAKRSK